MSPPQASVPISHPRALTAVCFRCGAPRDVRRLFDRMPHRDVLSWTLLISDCCNIDQFDMKLTHFRAMVEEGISPYEVALLTVLSATARGGQLQQRHEIHGRWARRFRKLRKVTVVLLWACILSLGGWTTQVELRMEGL